MMTVATHFTIGIYATGNNIHGGQVYWDKHFQLDM